MPDPSDRSPIARRNVLRGAAWTVPSAVAISMAPAYAASPEPTAACGLNVVVTDEAVQENFDVVSTAHTVIDGTTTSEGTQGTIWVGDGELSQAVDRIAIHHSVPMPDGTCANPQPRQVSVTRSDTRTFFFRNPTDPVDGADPYRDSSWTVTTDGEFGLDGGADGFYSRYLFADDAASDVGLLRVSGQRGTTTMTITTSYLDPFSNRELQFTTRVTLVVGGSKPAGAIEAPISTYTG